MPFEASLPGFRGPLEDLVRLVVQKQMDAGAVPLRELVAELTEYCRQAASASIDQQAEWLDLVARLILWKSRALCGESGGLAAAESEAVEARRELLRGLLSLDEIRRAAAALEERARIREGSSGGWREADVSRPSTLYDLLVEVRRLRAEAAQAKLDRQRVLLEMRMDETTVAEMRGWLSGRLLESPELDGLALLEEQPSPERRNCLFLAALDMARGQEVSLEQVEAFGPLRICRVEGEAP